MCLFPSVNHSSWAVLLLNGHSKSACYSSGENGYAKVFNTPLNQLRQSQLVLRHIFLFFFFLPLLTCFLCHDLRLPHCGEKCSFFFSLMDRVDILQPFSFRPSWQLHAVGHSRGLSGSNGIARSLYPDLPLRSLSCFSNALISELTSTHCHTSCYDSHFNLVDGKGQHSQRGIWLHWNTRLNRCYGLKHTVRHLVACVQHHARGVLKCTIRMTSGVFKQCL